MRKLFHFSFLQYFFFGRKMPINVKGMSISFQTHFIKYHLMKDKFQLKEKEKWRRSRKRCRHYGRNIETETEELIFGSKKWVQ
jgi:hypothetical protein